MEPGLGEAIRGDEESDVVSDAESEVVSEPEVTDIAGRLTSMIGHLADAYSSASRKKARMPEDQNLENLAATIDTIKGDGGGGGGSVDLPAGLDEDWGSIAGYLEKPISLTFGTRADFAEFCDSCAKTLNTVSAIIGVYPRNEVLSLYVGKNCEDIPDNLLMTPEEIDPTKRFGEHLQYVTLNQATTIGDNFLRNNINFNGELQLSENLQNVGDYFMGKNYSFNQHIDLPDSLKTVGESFLYACNTLPSLYVPAGAKPPSDRNSLSCDNQNALSYLSGLRLTGPGAAKWIAALPNRDTIPFRNLVSNPTGETYRRVRIQYDNYQPDTVEPVLDGRTATEPDPEPTYSRWYYDTPIVEKNTDDNCKIPVPMALQGYQEVDPAKHEVIVEFADSTHKAQTVLVEDGGTVRERFNLNDSLKIPYGDGRVFLGWSKCEPSEIVRHAVTIDPDNGEEPRRTQIVNGYTVNAPTKTPSKEGMKFVGWTDEEVVYHTVTFEDGKNTMTITVPDGEAVGWHEVIFNLNEDTLTATDGQWEIKS